MYFHVNMYMYTRMCMYPCALGFLVPLSVVDPGRVNICVERPNDRTSQDIGARLQDLFTLESWVFWGCRWLEGCGQVSK